MDGRETEPYVFICYRRKTDAYAAGLLFNSLERELGHASVFMDRSLPGGIDYRERIQEKLWSSRIVLVLIGPSWSPQDPSDTDDDVRYELELARELDRAILPVPLDDATWYDDKDWPEEFDWFARLNARPFRSSDQSAHVADIIDVINNAPPVRSAASARGSIWDRAGQLLEVSLSAGGLELKTPSTGRERKGNAPAICPEARSVAALDHSGVLWVAWIDRVRGTLRAWDSIETEWSGDRLLAASVRDPDEVVVAIGSTDKTTIWRVSQRGLLSVEQVFPRHCDAVVINQWSAWAASERALVRLQAPKRPPIRNVVTIDAAQSGGHTILAAGTAVEGGSAVVVAEIEGQEFKALRTLDVASPVRSLRVIRHFDLEAQPTQIEVETGSRLYTITGPDWAWTP